MASPYSTPVAWVDATGLHVPPFEEVLNYFQAAYRGIYGQDVYLGDDCQDGQWIGILAAALNDANAAYAANYQDRSPTTAVGEALSTLVKINGLSRAAPTYSTVDLDVTGQTGSEIFNGIASDGVNNWVLPPYVLIPYSGRVTVTATAQKLGAILAPAGAVTNILTVTRGWQAVNNPSDATAGAAIEQDPRLKARQRISTALPASSLFEGLIAALVKIPDVVEVRGYENDTDAVDPNGIPGHSLAVVIDGGDSQVIADTLRVKKGSGVGVYGDVAIDTVDAYGIHRTMRFFRPTNVPIAYYISVRALPGYTVSIRDAARQAIVDFTNSLAIGEPIYLDRVYVPARLNGVTVGRTYEIVSLVATRDGVPPGDPADVPIAFTERARVALADVTFTLVA